MKKFGFIFLTLVIPLTTVLTRSPEDAYVPVKAHEFVRVIVDASLPASGNWWSVAGTKTPAIRCAILCHHLGWSCKGFQISEGESECQPLNQNPSKLNQSSIDQLVTKPGMVIYGRQHPLSIQDPDTLDSAQDYPDTLDSAQYYYNSSAETDTEALPTGPTLANVPSDMCEANPCPNGPGWVCIGDDHFKGPSNLHHICLYCNTTMSSHRSASQACSHLMQKAELMVYNATSQWKKDAVLTMVNERPNCTANSYWVNAGTTQQQTRKTRDAEPDNSMEWTEGEELTGSGTATRDVNSYDQKKSLWKSAFMESEENEENIRSKRYTQKRQDSDSNSNETPPACDYFIGQNGTNFGQLKSTSCTTKYAYICELT